MRHWGHSWFIFKSNMESMNIHKLKHRFPAKNLIVFGHAILLINSPLRCQQPK